MVVKASRYARSALSRPVTGALQGGSRLPGQEGQASEKPREGPSLGFVFHCDQQVSKGWALSRCEGANEWGSCLELTETAGKPVATAVEGGQQMVHRQLL